MMNVHADKIIANKFIGEFENNSDGISIGMIIPFASNKEIPSGFLLCNGASIRKDTYIDLFNVIGTTYGSVDEKHFNLPNLNGKFLEGNDTSGIYKDAGLPNLEGNIGFCTSINGFAIEPLDMNNGVFKNNLNYNGPVAQLNVTNSGQFSSSVSFNASRSNAIYGNSTTVQPNSLTIRYIIKAFNEINSSSTTDLEITKLANDLSDKANRDLSNLSEIGRKVIADGDLTENGWTKLSNSLILQWGSHYHGDIADNIAHTLSFNIPFPNKCLQVIVSTSETGTGCGFALRVGEPTTTTFLYAMNEFSSVVQKTTILWFAVGY